MQRILFCIASIVCGGTLAAVTLNKLDIEKREFNHNQPRIFFKQMAEASGLFPIEINVPDTISSMMSGMNSMYQAASAYFGSGSEGGVEGGEQSQMQDEVSHISRPINGKQRRKKVKRVRKKTGTKSDDEANLLFINFILNLY